jgi:hypothetical protein
MKVATMLKSLLLGSALLLATSALAANEGSLEVRENVSVAGKQLPAGNYMLKWKGNGPEVEVNILQGKKLVATVPARVFDLDRAPERNAAVTRTDGDATSLAEIQFAGSKHALAIGEESAKESSNGSR